MINETVFFAHVFFVLVVSLGAFLLGKEALIGLIAVQTIVSNLFIAKQISLFSLSVTPCDAFTVGVVLGLNLLQEHFGMNITKRTIWLNAFITLVFIGFSQIQLAYLPTALDTMHSHYEALLLLIPRITIASLVTYLVSQWVDAHLYALLRIIMPLRGTTLCAFISMSTSQLLDTVLFSFLGLYGIVSDVWAIIVVSFAIKMMAIIMVSPCVAFSYVLKRRYVR